MKEVTLIIEMSKMVWNEELKVWWTPYNEDFFFPGASLDDTSSVKKEEQQKEHKCNCDMQLLLREGCKCGGK